MAARSHPLAQLTQVIHHLREFEQGLRNLGIDAERFSGWGKALPMLERLLWDLPAGGLPPEGSPVSAVERTDTDVSHLPVPEFPSEACLVTDARGIILE